MRPDDIEVSKSYLWDVAYGTPQVVTVLGITQPRSEWMNGAQTYQVRNAKGREYPLFGYQLKPLPAELRPLAPLIGLTGKKRVGKDTVARLLAEQYGFRRVAFADRLKATALALNPWVHLDRWNDVPYRLSEVVAEQGWDGAKELYPEVRRTLQHLGEAVKEQVAEDAWTSEVFGVAYAHRQAGTPVVVTDVRFPIELDALREAGGLLVRIERDVEQNDSSNHISETALDEEPADWIIDNNDGLDSLALNVKDLASEVGITIPTRSLALTG